MNMFDFTVSSMAEDRKCQAWVGLGWVGLGWVGLGWVGLGYGVFQQQGHIMAVTVYQTSTSTVTSRSLLTPQVSDSKRASVHESDVRDVLT